MILDSVLPNDRRNFIHKRIIGGVKGFASGGFTGAARGFIQAGSGQRASPGTGAWAPTSSDEQRQYEGHIMHGHGPWATSRALGRHDKPGHRGDISVRQWAKSGRKAAWQAPAMNLAQFPPSLVPAPGFIPAMERMVPGGASGMMAAPAGMGCPAGYHPNKSNYYTAMGPVPKGTRCVKNRRRNALNPRALTRAVGRVKSAKVASKVLSSITIRKKC